MTPALRLLHLEDDPPDAELIAAALQADGLAFETSVVSTRPAFVAALQRGGIDLILADFSLPGFDGAAALALAQERCPDVPVIIVSGLIGEEAVVAVLQAGATDCVIKGHLGRLGPAVRRALRDTQARLARQQAEQALRQQARRLQGLAEASRVFAEVGLDPDAAVEVVTQTVMRTIGDGCLLLLREAGRWGHLAGLAHFDPQAAALARRLLAAGPLHGKLWRGPAMLADQPLFLPHTSPDQFRASFDPSLWPYLDRYGLHSLLVVPLRRQGALAGALAVWRDVSDIAYTEDDLVFLQDLAGRAALTLERAHAYAEVRALNAELEERVHARTAELAHANQQLAGSNDLLAAANQRLEAEIALQRVAEQEFRQLLEAAPDAMVIVNSRGEILLINSQTEALFGYTRAELIGQPVETLLPDRFHGSHTQHRAEYLAAPRLRRMGAVQELFGRRKDGRLFPVETSLSPLERPDDLLVLASVRDISERRSTETAIRLHSTILANMAEGVLLVRLADDTIVYANAKAEALFGYAPGELVGLPITRLNSPANGDPAETARRLNAASQQPGGWSGEISNIRKDGTTFWSLANVSTILHAEHGLCAVSIQTDITERKLAQAQLEETGEQLRGLSARLQAVREDERARLAREVHDELGQDLSSLSMDLAWIQKRLLPEQQPVLDKTAAMAGLLGAAIKSVRRITGELRPGLLDDFGLVAALEWQLGQFQAETGLRCHLQAQVPEVELSPDRATAAFRVFQEILANIVKHAQASAVTVNVERHNGHVLLQVADDGRGISPAELADPRSLGLLGMRERVRLLSGELSIDGRPGRGTTVAVKIPLDNPA